MSFSVEIGDIVELCGDHPFRGNKGVVVHFPYFAGKPSMVVKLRRNDAMDGHEVGVTSRSQFEVQSKPAPKKTKRKKK